LYRPIRNFFLEPVSYKAAVFRDNIQVLDAFLEFGDTDDGGELPGAVHIKADDNLKQTLMASTYSFCSTPRLQQRIQFSYCENTHLLYDHKSSGSGIHYMYSLIILVTFYQLTFVAICIVL